MQTEEINCNKTFTHFACIICSPEDRRWAARLKRRLQFYRLPIKTQRSHRNLPRSCRPISGGTAEKKQSAVETAKFLIVICSRHAREHSVAMDAQIKSFLDGNGEVSRILPFIVDGCKHPVEECFPTCLEALCREHTIVGTNIFDHGTHTALMKLLAAMLGLKVEELEGTEARRKKRNRRTAAVLAALLLIASAVYWDYSRTKTAYYLDYTEVYGVPRGIGRLSEKELSGLHRYYAITRSRGRARELKVINAPGNCFDMGIRWEDETKADLFALVTPERDFARAVYEYSEDWALKSAAFYDDAGNLLINQSYVNKNTADVSQNRSSRLLPSSAITRLLIEYDNKGYLRELRYVDDKERNRAAADENGVFGLRYERDEKGRPIRSINLINSGGNAEFASTYAPGADVNGVLAWEYEYEEEGGLIAWRQVDAEGRPVPGGEGYAELRLHYDAKHNLSQIDYIGADGEPFAIEKGYCSLRLLYGERGKIIGHRFLGADGKGRISNDGYAGFDSLYSGDTETCCRYLGMDGEPVLNSLGFSSCFYEINPESRCRTMTYFGLDGKPVQSNNGFVTYKREYDGEYPDNVVRESYYDAEGRLMLNPAGVAGFTKEYDAWGCETRLSYFDAEGKPTINQIDGYCSCRNEYNQRGLVVRQSYYDPKGRPVLCKKGLYHSIKPEYDSHGNKVRESFYGTDGSLIRNVYGEAQTVIECWPDGTERSVSCYDEKGNPLPRSCIAAYSYENTSEISGPHDMIIFTRLGDWHYAEKTADFSECIPDPGQSTTLEYLRYDKALGRYELFHSDFTMGEMGLRIVGYMITDEEYEEIAAASKEEAKDGPLEKQAREGTRP